MLVVGVGAHLGEENMERGWYVRSLSEVTVYHGRMCRRTAQNGWVV